MIRRLFSQASHSLVVMGACLWAATLLGCAERATPPLAHAPTATIVAVEGAGTTYHSRDWNGKTVTIRVPSSPSPISRIGTRTAPCRGPSPVCIRRPIR